MATESSPRPRPTRPTLRERSLRTAPTLIAVLWVAGICRFRNLPLRPLDYAALLAAALSLQVVLGRLQARRPLPALPPQANPTVVATIAAAITGSLGLLVGGVVESLVPTPPGDEPPALWLRTVWHGTCAFGASYCRFLARLHATAARRR